MIIEGGGLICKICVYEEKPYTGTALNTVSVPVLAYTKTNFLITRCDKPFELPSCHADQSCLDTSIDCSFNSCSKACADRMRTYFT